MVQLKKILFKPNQYQYVIVGKSNIYIYTGIYMQIYNKIGFSLNHRLLFHITFN